MLVVGFSGSLLPNDATNQGELDANVFQHRPFLAEDNKAHNYKLVAVANTFVFPMAGYSRKIKSVSEPEGRRNHCDSKRSHQPWPRAVAAAKREADYP